MIDPIELGLPTPSFLMSVNGTATLEFGIELAQRLSSGALENDSPIYLLVAAPISHPARGPLMRAQSMPRLVGAAARRTPLVARIISSTEPPPAGFDRDTLRSSIYARS